MIHYIFNKPSKYHNSPLGADHIVENVEETERCTVIATPTLTLHTNLILPSCLTHDIVSFHLFSRRPSLSSTPQLQSSGTTLQGKVL
jgi:hypothetical protein